MPQNPIGRSFYYQPTLIVARSLLGMVLVHNSPEGTTAGTIIETEAYTGLDDPASHSYKKGSKRVSIQYKASGSAYIYLIYGMYYCFNVTSGPKGSPEVVLIRALEPLKGIELMRSRRKKAKDLCSGPGKLTMAMGITMEHYGADLVESELFIAPSEKENKFKILTTKRINIDYAGYAADFPYRFLMDKNK